MKEYGYFSNKSYVITQRDTPRLWSNFLFNDDYISSISQVGVGDSFFRNKDEEIIHLVSDRAVYIVEDNHFWQASALSVHTSLQNYHCVHSIGYSDILLTQNRVKTECRFFVANEGKREFLRVSIKNESRNTKSLKIIPYFSVQLNNKTHFASFSDEKNCVISHLADNKTCAYLMSTDIITGFDTRQSAFLGIYGNKLQPKAIFENKSCSNSDCFAEQSCLVLENSVTLAPGESKTIYYTVGVEQSENAITQLLPAEIEEQFAAMQERNDSLFDQINLRTPWSDLNSLCNHWLKYQASLSAVWGKIDDFSSADIATACMCTSVFDTASTKKHIISLLCIQDSVGFISDTTNDVWCVLAAYELTKELGSFDFLQKKIPFSNGENATVYEHLKRLIHYFWNHTGDFGLIKTANDEIEVLNSFVFVYAAKLMIQMANWMGQEADSKSVSHFAQEMENRINRYAWKGNYYLNNVSKKDSKVFSLPQIWSVLSDFNRERREYAMDTVEQNLSTDLGILDSTQNQTVNLPSAVWKLAADSLLQRNDMIEEGLRKILPTHNEFFKTCGEPYALYDFYYGEDAGYRVGTPSSAWKTLTGPLLLYVLTRHVFGLQAEFGGLLISPTLPPSWIDCSISKMFRGCQYNVHYVQQDRDICNKIDSIYVNGVKVDPKLPIKPQPNKTLNIEVILQS